MSPRWFKRHPQLRRPIFESRPDGRLPGNAPRAHPVGAPGPRLIRPPPNSPRQQLSPHWYPRASRPGSDGLREPQFDRQSGLTFRRVVADIEQPFDALCDLPQGSKAEESHAGQIIGKWPKDARFSPLPGPNPRRAGREEPGIRPWLHLPCRVWKPIAPSSFLQHPPGSRAYLRSGYLHH
jgi:hypothetical protein